MCIYIYTHCNHIYTVIIQCIYYVNINIMCTYFIYLIKLLDNFIIYNIQYIDVRPRARLKAGPRSNHAAAWDV